MLNKILKRNNLGLILVAILLFQILRLGHTLRSNAINIIPEVQLDEYTWVWQGLSFRKTGIPAGWSDLNAYTKGVKDELEIVEFNIWVDGKNPSFSNFSDFPSPALAVPTIDLGEGDKQIRYVQPLIEQPPLGGVLTGIFIPGRINGLLNVTPSLMRQSSLIFASITTLLLFTLAFQIFKNPWIALLASVIYSTVPSFNLLSRYALPENVLTPLLLTFLNLLYLSLNFKGKLLATVLIIAGILVGLSTLIKITAWPFIFSSVFLLLVWKYPKKQILFFLMPAIFLGSLFFIWAFYIDSKLFMDIVFSQGFERKFIGSINFLVSVLQVRLDNFPVDGWWIGGFLSLTLVPFTKERLPILLGVLTTFFTVLFFGGSLYPWYLIPAVPFICISTAAFIASVVSKPNILNCLVFFLIFVSSSFYWGYGVFHEQSFLIYRILLAFFVLSGFAFSLYSKIARFRLIWMGFIVLLLYQLLEWNHQSTLYILANWGKLPFQFTP